MSTLPLVASPIVLYPAFVLLNFLNFVDRSIIPATSDEFLVFIASSVSTARPNVYLGVLQSAFIVGFALASIVFSSMIRTQGAFHVCAVGLIGWVIAAVGAGISLHFRSFWGFLLSRMLSGIGEASLVGSAAPWIAENAPPRSKGMWLAVFYTATPMGTAFGYSYASYVADHVGHYWAFLYEAVAMVPVIMVFLLAAPYHRPRHTPMCSTTGATGTSETYDESFFTAIEEDPGAEGNVGYDGYVQLLPPHDDSVDLSHLDANVGSTSPVHHASSPTCKHQPQPQHLKQKHTSLPRPSSVRDDVTVILGRRIFVCITLACAAQVAVTAGLGCFGPSFLMGLEYFNSETAAASAFGAMVLLAGIIGTPLGGFLADYCQTCDSGAVNPGVVTHKAATEVDDEDEDEDEVDAEKSVYKEERPSMTSRGSKIATGHTALITTTIATETTTSTTRTGAATELLVNQKAISIFTHRTLRVMMGIVAISTLGATCCLCGTYWSTDRVSFVLLVTAGCLLIFLCNPAINMGLMLSVPLHTRSVALALTSVCVHVFGDVPSPVLTGILKDFISPGCAFSSRMRPNGAIADDGDGAGDQVMADDDDARAMMMKSRSCQAEKWGIRATMLLVSMWLLVAFTFYCAAWYFAHVAVQQDKNEEQQEQEQEQEQQGRGRGRGHGREVAQGKSCCCCAANRRHVDTPDISTGPGSTSLRVEAVSSPPSSSSLSRGAGPLKASLAQPLLPSHVDETGAISVSLSHTWT